MFHKGDSHKCDPNSNEVHDKRHREVARLIQKLRQLDAGEPACSRLSAELKTDTTDDDEKENAFRQEYYAYMVPKRKLSNTPKQTIKVFIGHIATQTKLDRETSHIKISYDAVGDQKYEALLAERLKLRFVKETLARLNIQPVIPKSTKERRVLVFKIIEAIFLDIKYLANEAHETLKRAGGYWLYANKRAYRNMVENNKEVDWETGEKIQFEDEESDLE
ncbi:hypothetical protein LOZ58_004054 [Ophidiomyces ophidiicola]|nr:hypothetical protein LOZ58_004054 [Ophidiomyces ophidiicola]